MRESKTSKKKTKHFIGGEVAQKCVETLPKVNIDPAEVDCFLTDTTTPGNEVLQATWKTVFTFAVSRKWVFGGGWAQHIFLTQKDVALALYDERRNCTTGDFDVFMMDPVADLVALAQLLHKQTGYSINVSGGMRRNIYHLSFNYGGVSVIDAMYISPRMLASLVVHMVETQHGILRILDPLIELSRLYQAVSSVHLLRSGGQLMKRFKRIWLLEEHAAVDAARGATFKEPLVSKDPHKTTMFKEVIQDATSATNNANANANAKNANAKPKSERYPRAALVGLTSYRVTLGHAAEDVDGPMELAVHDPMLPGLLEACLRVATTKIDPDARLVLYDAFTLFMGPQYSAHIDIVCHGRALVRVHCSAIPIHCATVGNTVVAAFHHQMTHLYWAHQLGKYLDDSQRMARCLNAFYHSFLIYEDVTRCGPSKVDAFAYIIDRDHMCGELPTVPPFQRFNMQRAKGVIPSLRITSSLTNPPDLHRLSRKGVYTYKSYEAAKLATTTWKDVSTKKQIQAFIVSNITELMLSALTD